MSPGRSRSARQVEADHVEAVEEILAETSGLDLEPEIAVADGDDPDIDLERRGSHPTRCTSRSCSVRSSFACTASGISLTSSSTRVPPAATSNHPVRRPTAPVKAPRSWPNSSDSTRVSGSAQQLTATKGPPARGLASWMKRAINSLPVPVSPWISTVASVPATRRARASVVSIRGLSVSTGARRQVSPASPPRVSERMPRTSSNVNGLQRRRARSFPRRLGLQLLRGEAGDQDHRRVRGRGS